MRRLLTIAAVMGLTALPLLVVGCKPASAKSGSVKLTAENVRVVIANDAGPVVRFAADEMTNFLSRVLGGPVPIGTEVEKRGGGGERWVNIILGENVWSRAKGLEPEKQLKPDGFYILAEGNNIYLCGHDDPKADIRQALKEARAPQYGSQFHRSTLFAVYDFLERFAGVRFYFPGSDDLGIITPRQTSVTVPAGKIVEEPYFDVVRRWTSPGSPRVDVGGALEGESKGAAAGVVKSNNLLNMYRLRIKAVDFPNNHGATHLELQERFGKTHPEYFALMADSATGKRFRDCEPVKRGYPPCQVCWSSGIVDELIKDGLAYARGDDPKTRGFKNGYPQEGLACGWMCFSPADGFRGCLCEKCQAGYDKSKQAYATEVVQEAVAKVAKGVLDSGLMVFASAYSSYMDIPTCDMPSNVVMNVARTGPWAEVDPKRRDKEFQDVVDWTKKTGQRVTLHNWACKYSKSKIPGPAALTPEAIGSYYSRIAPYARGAYMESSSERRSHVYLNIYLYSKLAWNPKFDWKAALDEHDRLMFGAGAEPMRKIYRRLEEVWLNKICNNVMETNMGTIILPPSINDIWGKVYDDRLIAELRALKEEALEKVKGDKSKSRVEVEERMGKFHSSTWTSNFDSDLHARRIRLLADDLIGSIAYAHDAYATEHSVAREEAYRKASTRPNLLADLKPNDYHFVRRANEPDTATQVMPKIELKGKTKYRLSAYVKFKDVVPTGKMGGVWVAFWDHANQKWYLPGTPGLTGSSDWMSVSGEFTTWPKPEVRELRLQLRDAQGEAWIRDVRLEEVK